VGLSLRLNASGVRPPACFNGTPLFPHLQFAVLLPCFAANWYKHGEYFMNGPERAKFLLLTREAQASQNASTPNSRAIAGLMALINLKNPPPSAVVMSIWLCLFGIPR
jgi:hypothetical protein